MGDDDHGHALGSQILHDTQDFANALGVEGGGRLVEQDQLRIHDECPRDADALLLAAGEL